MQALLRMLHKKAQALWIWQSLFIAAVGWGFLNGHLAEQTAMGRMRFVAMDSRDTLYLSHMGTFDDASRIRLETAKDAVATIFSRNPDGFDFPERLERLFNPETTAKLHEEAKRDADVFKAQQIRQKIETGQITELSVDSNTALESVECQIQRTGLFNQKIVNDTRKVTVFLRLTLNDDIAHNGRYPMEVTNYEERFE